MGVGVCFLADFEEVVGVCSGVTVKLDVGVMVAWNPVDVRVTQDQDWFTSFKKPVLDFTGGACDVVIGSVKCQIWGCGS